MIMVNGYETLIASMMEEGLGDGEIGGLRNRRDIVIRTFIAMREAHRELVRQRGDLAHALEAAFCIMGPAVMTGSAAPGGGDMHMSSALFANTLLTGRSVTPGQDLLVILWSLLASFVALILVHLLGSKVTLIAGFVAGLLCLAGFGISFIVSGYWIDPLISTAAVFGGTLFLAVSRLCIVHFKLLRFYRETMTKEQWAEFYFGDIKSSKETRKASRR